VLAVSLAAAAPGFAAGVWRRRRHNPICGAVAAAAPMEV